MPARILLDTNILVYAYDRREPVKRDAALALARALAHTGEVAVTTQVLSELFWTISRSIPDPLPAADAARSVRRHAATWHVVDVTADTVREALRGAEQHGLPYWDALIWAAARLAGIPVVLSEDFQDGREIDGVAFQNPFGGW
jgi:predicted nucleic acid-binding protein